MSKQKIKAILFGATGLAGSGVLLECLKNPEVEKLTVITRRSTGKSQEKLTEIIHSDYLDYSGIEEQLKDHNTCFYCLGVSQTQVKGEQEYRKITLDFTLAAAEVLIKVNKDMTFCFLSGTGTDSAEKSRMMWARVKGEAENKLGNFPFRRLYHFRPAYIHPVDGIKHSLFLGKILGPLYPVFNRLLPSIVTTTREFGSAMINAVLQNLKSQIFENSDIRELGKENQ